MVNTESQWLQNLEGTIPTKGLGNKFSMYTLTLEAWRRGIQVTFYTIENPDNKLLIRYSLSYNGKIHHFESSRGDKISKEAYEICDNKQLTKYCLEEAGVPVPKGEYFDGNVSDQEIIHYANRLGYPLVVKPVSENAGKGVFANIECASHLQEVLTHVRDELRYRDILLEEHIDGDDYRIYMVDNKVISAVKRVPANIIGDGIHTIQQLIDQKNEERKKNPVLYKLPIVIDMEVERSITKLGYHLNSVVKKGELVLLRSKSNISRGGDPIEVTDQLSESVKNIAVNASKAIPGLAQCGLDMMVNEKENKGVVIEANTKPGLGVHLFPLIGRSYDILIPTIDYYFPETKNKPKSDLYFDLESALDPIKSYATNKVELTPPPLGKVTAKKYIVTLSENNSEIKNAIRRQALKRNLHGYINKIDNESVEIVIASHHSEQLVDFMDTCIESLENVNVTILKEQECHKPVRVGFSVIKDTSTKGYEKKIEKIKAKNEVVSQELKEKHEQVTQELKAKNEELKRVKMQKASAIKVLKEVESDLKKEKAEKKFKIKSLKRELKEEIIKRNNLLAENKKLTKEKQHFEKKYARLINSRSWQYTKPIRKVLSIIRK